MIRASANNSPFGTLSDIDVSDLSAAREETLLRIRLILDSEVRAGQASDLARYAVIAEPTGRVVLVIPFSAAMSGRATVH